MPDAAWTDADRDQVVATLRTWLQRCRITMAAYNAASVKATAADRRLGVPAAALSAVVATSVFATAQAETAVELRLATGGLAVGAAVLAALQAFLRHGERAEQYREAARRYGGVRRRIEQALVLPPEGREEARALLCDVAAALDDAGRGKPNVPGRIWARAKRNTPELLKPTASRAADD